MAHSRRPTFLDRTTSSPLGLFLQPPVSENGDTSLTYSRQMELTPPASPLSSRHSRSSSDLSQILDADPPDLSDLQEFQNEFITGSAQSNIRTSSLTEDGILLCPYDVELLKNNHGQDQIFGHGAWSTVLKATCRRKALQRSGLATPPPSPKPHQPMLVAVKKPARKDAIPILQNEAKILTYLMGQSGHKSYVVNFFGIIPADSSIILSAIPRSLEDFISASCAHAAATRTTSNMTQPVIGSEMLWLDLADRLVSGLAWLHNRAMVVHGDIKPGNILLSSFGESGDEASFRFDPLFTDFSSSQILDQKPSPNTLSAITREYTAPELLSSKVLLDPESAATSATDVFSLAVTLLVSATGNTMVYSGSMFQRQAMAVQGWGVINNVRNGSNDGLRIPRQGMVQKCLEKAVLKVDMGRIDAESWKTLIQNMKLGEPVKTSQH